MSEMEYQCSVLTPILMTSGSSLKIDTREEALKNENMDKIIIINVPSFIAKKNPCFTLEQYFAPQLNAETGWNPCPIPIAIQNMKLMIRVTIEMAATAASP